MSSRSLPISFRVPAIARSTALATALALFAASSSMGGESLGAEPRSYLTEIPEILQRSPQSDWQRIRDEDLLYFELSSGTVIMELAPFATPQNADQLRALARSGYYDDSAILRAQEDYVVQWGDPTEKRSLGSAPKVIVDERSFALADSRKLTPLDALDSYAPRTGFVDAFPVGVDATAQRAWIAHCHGVVGVVHDDPKTTVGGTFLYAVIGHRPRELDGKLAIGGRIIEGIELLSTLPRGEGVYSFYPKEKYITIPRARVAADVPAPQRRSFEKLRTDSETFAKILAAKRGSGKGKSAPIDVCSVPLPVREVPHVNTARHMQCGDLRCEIGGEYCVREFFAAADPPRHACRKLPLPECGNHAVGGNCLGNAQSGYILEIIHP